jgi:translation initiation factor IF-2
MDANQNPATGGGTSTKGRVQVCKMAKDMALPVKDLLELFQSMGVEVKNHLAWVEDNVADAARQRYVQKQQAAEVAPAIKPEVKAATVTPSVPASPVSSRAGLGANLIRHVVPPAPTQVPPVRRAEGVTGAPKRGEARPEPRKDGRPVAARPELGGVPPRQADGRRAERDGGRGAHRRGPAEDEQEVQLPLVAKKGAGRRKSRAEQKQEREERRIRRRDRDRDLSAPPTSIDLIGSLTVKELAEKMKVKETEIIKRLFLKGIMATINQTIEKETAEMIAVELGYEVNLVDPIQQALAATSEEYEDPADLLPRPPIVTIMGHVDHGKTSLLDALRSARVASGEAGGITQHIGAYMTSLRGNEICFLDTPGHEAFTAMRARGAKATDIAVLVVAADDGVMPQTIEAISHAKAAGVPIIVAINKIDKPDASPDRVKQELTEYELVPEEWGGQTVMVEVSAKKKLNLDQLLEMILLVAEVQELKANPNKPARGLIVEAKLSKSMGPVATVLVQSGTLRVGDPFVVGSIAGKVRALINDRGKRVKEAGPAHPVEVLGCTEVPHAGDVFQVVDSEKAAKALADSRALAERDEKLSARARMTLKNFYTRIQEGQKELPIIIKADVKGSSEAIEQALSQVNERMEGVTIRVLLSANGDVSETDVNLAAASDALVIGFNVKVDERASRAAEDASVDVRLYSIIYKMIEDLEMAMKGLLEPEFETVRIGRAEVRAVFKSGKTSVIAGCMVLEGKIERKAEVKLYRGKDLIFEGKLENLKRFKDDAKEVAAGYECGMSLEKFNDIVEGDIIEAFVTREKER